MRRAMPNDRMNDETLIETLREILEKMLTLRDGEDLPGSDPLYRALVGGNVHRQNTDAPCRHESGRCVCLALLQAYRRQ